jgi:hypothetical protein
MDKYIRPTDPSKTSGTLSGRVEKPPKQGSWGGRGGYFLARQRKQQSQAPKAKTTLFTGCQVYFTCCVSQPQIYLSRLIWENGGVVTGGWSRKTVTHVIADRLASAKLEKELQSVGKSNAWRGSIVRPDWVTDCVAKMDRLPTYEYRILRSGMRNIAKLLDPRYRANDTPSTSSSVTGGTKPS